MSPALFAGLLLFAVASAATPGPNNLMMMASGARFGLRRSVPHMSGVVLGFGAMTLAIGLGLAGVFKALPWLYLVLRWGAGAYIVYLALHLALAKAPGQAPTEARPMRFWGAVAFQWVNPKAWVMALGAVTTYAEPGRLVRDVGLIAGVFMLVNVPCALGWTAFGLGIRRVLRRPLAFRAFNVGMALLLLASLYPLVTEPIGPTAAAGR